ncbi:ABC transporter related [Alkaliphilus metalliredigens QYMF]|uniref:ABC transporter related n=1 Tax=Alkaliphilus metalliredigens (strain QYMF) TaxID=293826 RepID=A6TV15_ALKMQ|nr:ABC transporter ATP-binding protein [Alkaliphilus metalliredigens]ABR50033.1 ABC transporter related [Alkaliphilus metalliredigens QYMF]
MMNFDVKLTNVSFKYNDFQALKDISFTLSQGKIYGLLGRNGAGKTTLLSLLASFNTPTSGTIRIGCEDPFENSKIMPNVAFLYESDYSEEDESVLDYFEASERYRPNFDTQYAKELAARFKLPLNKPINEFSSGMQSALNVILGLASRSPITIFDEVYLGMDAPTRELFYREVLEEQSRHPRIIILSTHLVSEMEYLFDHVLILDQGSVLVDEAIDEVIGRGASITGPADVVDKFVNNMKQLHTQELGNTKSIMVYGEISETDEAKANRNQLEIGSVSLQQLFIYLTEKEEE